MGPGSGPTTQDPTTQDAVVPFPGAPETERRAADVPPPERRASKCCWRTRADRSGRAATRAPGRFRRAASTTASSRSTRRFANSRKRRAFNRVGRTCRSARLPSAAERSCTRGRFEGNCDPAALVSMDTTVEWPARSGRQIVVPEIDRARVLLNRRRTSGREPGAGGTVRSIDAAVEERFVRRRFRRRWTLGGSQDVGGLRLTIALRAPRWPSAARRRLASAPVGWHRGARASWPR